MPYPRENILTAYASPTVGKSPEALEATAETASEFVLAGAKAKGYTVGSKLTFTALTALVTTPKLGVEYFIVKVATNGFELSETREGAAIKVAGAAITNATKVQQIPYLPSAKEPVAVSNTPKSDMRIRIVRIEQSFSTEQTTPVPMYVEDGVGGIFPPETPLTVWLKSTFNVSEPEVQVGPGLPVTVRVPAVTSVFSSVCLYYAID